MQPADPQLPDNSSRQRLLDALAQSIRERGLQRTQITDIVRIARMSRRTFYECFADKESCFIELIESARAAVQGEILAAVQPDAAWTTQIDQAVDAFLAALARDPALGVTISHELPTLGLRGLATQREATELYAQLVVQLSESEQMRAAGVGPASLEAAVMLVGGIGELLDRARFRGELVDSIAPVVKRVAKAMLQYAS